MVSWLADAYTVNEVVEAYLAMESLLQAPGFTQDEQGMLAAIIEHLDAADSASITELHSGVFLTLAASDQAARDADALQYEMESGPCLDAIKERTVFAPIDLETDRRWPDFGLKVANTLGFNSMLSLRLMTDVPDSIYGLNIYARAKGAFDKQAVLFGLLVGTYASSVVLASVSRNVILNLEKALQSNR